MIPAFIITFREVLEAALIVGIVLSYLVKIKREKYNNIVYLAIISAIVASIIGAFLFNMLAGGFSGQAEVVFEGVVMLIGALLITFMILWMYDQKHIVMELCKKVDTEINHKHKAGLFLIVFFAVFREGIETVIFLSAASFADGGGGMLGALLGLIFAVTLGYFIFVIGKKINIKIFFNVTSILLILFAAGLTAHGIHELQQAEIVPVISEHVWDINPQVRADGSYPYLHEKGAIGSIFKGLFGYNANPSLIEVISYAIYILLIIIMLNNRKTRQKNN